MSKYPSQQNRKILWISPEHLKTVKSLTEQWTQETGYTWTTKAIVESLIDLAARGQIRPISGARKVE